MKTMYKIFVGNVDFKTEEEELRKLFEPHIVIEELVIAREPDTGKSRGYGFILTKDHQAARQAIRRVGKLEIDGRRVYLKEAHGKRRPPKPSRPSRPPRRPRHPRPQVHVPRVTPPRPSGSGPASPPPAGAPPTDSGGGYTGIDDNIGNR
ncbi:MAG: RNA-binding protein [Phycisphaerae bacterium]|nr:RNA-binding protein [Phycisphaerae bacterium]